MDSAFILYKYLSLPKNASDTATLRRERRYVGAYMVYNF